MTVRSLRELARKVIGPGHSRFRTKSELVAALEDSGKKVASAGRKVAAAGEKAGTRVREATQRAAGAAKASRGEAKKPSPRAAEGPPKRKAGAIRKAGAAAVAAAGAVAGAAAGALSARARKRKAGERAAPRAEPERGAIAEGDPSATGDERGGILPDPEGYFVARVRGEDAVREAPRPMSEGLAVFRGEEGTEGHPIDEGLGELPWSYGDDAFVALPRDPRTLFLYWDHASETRAAALGGLEHARAQLWIFARRDGDWERFRIVDVTLEARSWYVHDLEPGRAYRAELHAVDRSGVTRLIGRGSNEVVLPPFGPSPILDDRFIRLPWTVPLGRLLGPGHPGAPFSEEARRLLAGLSDWGRYADQAGGGSESAGGGAGGLGGRFPSGGPTSSPSSPTSPFGPFGGGGGR